MLQVQLKRFSPNDGSRIDTPVTINEQIDLSRYMSSVTPTVATPSPSPSQSTTAAATIASGRGGCLYGLVSQGNHLESRSGFRHYTALGLTRRSPPYYTHTNTSAASSSSLSSLGGRGKWNEWTLFDDSLASSISSTEVISAQWRTSVYFMLFERI
jgi:hypothetical protein